MNDDFRFIGILIAIVAVGSTVGTVATFNGGAGDSGSGAHAVKLNILPSQKFVDENGNEYKLGDEIKLPADKKLIGTLYSENCSGESRRIDGNSTFDSIGSPLCEADCNDANSKNLELLADKVETCASYFAQQSDGTNVENPSDESDSDEELEDFPEDYVFGEEVK